MCPVCANSWGEVGSAHRVRARARHRRARGSQLDPCPSIVASMGKNAAGRSFEPPAADYRRKTGNFHRKVGKAELKETETRAVARRQDTEITKVLIGLIIFAIFRREHL